MRNLVTFLAGLALAASAQAVDVAGVNIPDKASVGGQELVLNGAGVRTRLMFKVYVGSLYVPAKVKTAAEAYGKTPRRIQLNMLRDVTSDQMIDALNDGLNQANSPAEAGALKSQMAELAGILKSIGQLKEMLSSVSRSEGGLSDDEIDRLASRVVERLSEKIVREIAWEVIPDVAELVIKQRIKELEAGVE